MAGGQANNPVAPSTKADPPMRSPNSAARRCCVAKSPDPFSSQEGASQGSRFSYFFWGGWHSPSLVELCVNQAQLALAILLRELGTLKAYGEWVVVSHIPPKVD